MRTVRTRTVFSGDKLTVTAIESLEFRTDTTTRWRHMTGSLTPIAVVVREPDRTWAIDMDAQPVDIDKLEQQ